MDNEKLIFQRRFQIVDYFTGLGLFHVKDLSEKAEEYFQKMNIHLEITENRISIGLPHSQGPEKPISIWKNPISIENSHARGHNVGVTPIQPPNNPKEIDTSNAYASIDHNSQAGLYNTYILDKLKGVVYYPAQKIIYPKLFISVNINHLFETNKIKMISPTIFRLSNLKKYIENETLIKKD